ncbi:hypothetical protein MJM45_32445, partial [Salmonella enterica subsp. enterica serovar Kentucky]|nr:hypothetical protein [Salmonella enterica subsp. enterica serovar Kentucky]
DCRQTTTTHLIKQHPLPPVFVIILRMTALPAARVNRNQCFCLGEVSPLKKSAMGDDGTILSCSCVPKTALRLEN